ncbi:hypothetical protein ORN12_18490 [Pantoea vagans]|uniref:hypothetical protein n=1 Tax=Pantoea vagans TaxID=470934 RepID=UPI00224CAE40|nr:hypothetical protein [Pantoea vagans]MCX3310959.1 hypothetical protein [Pantoea vagans]
MAMVNARIDDDLKARVDAVLQSRNNTVTQNITDLYNYIDQHGQSPFMAAPRPHTAYGVASKCCSDLLNIRDALLLFQHHSVRHDTSDMLVPLYQMLTRSRLSLADNLCWLHSAPALPSSMDRLLQSFAQAQRLIAECDVNLSGGSRDGLRLSDDALSSLTANFNELNKEVISLCENVGIFHRPPPAVTEEQRFDGEFCTVFTKEAGFPGHVDVIVLIRPDLLRLLTPRLKEAMYCPRLPGWTPGVDINSGFNTFIPAPADHVQKMDSSTAFAMAASGGAMGVCGLLFVKGETRIHYWPEKSAQVHPVSRDMLPEAVSVEIESHIRNILQGSDTK